MKIRAIYVTMLVLAIGLLVYSTPAMATHGTSPEQPFSGHWDNWTVNDTDNVGLKGYLFIPAFLRLDCDSRAIHGPPAGFSKSDGAFHGHRGIVPSPGGLGTPAFGPTISDAATEAEAARHTNGDASPLFGNNGGCTEHAWDALTAWIHGGYFDPRGGTNFIPPSGDHHRSGWRMLMRVPFSGGSWLSGFAPALGAFPNFVMTGLEGAGEAPEAVLRYCQAANGKLGPEAQAEAIATGLAHYGDLTLVPDVTGSIVVGGQFEPSGGPDSVVDCVDRAAIAGAALLAFVDHHGEPLTPGRFPRYIPHERQGWPNTVVSSYTASSQNEGHGISQLFETSTKFLDGADSTEPVTWFSMGHDESGAYGTGCGGWCEWFYDPTTHTLCKREGGTPGVRTITMGSTGCESIGAGAAPIEVTQEIVVDDLNAGTNGHVLITHTLRKFEKSPVVIYQKLGQFVEMDTDAATPNFQSTAGPNTFSPSKIFTHNSGNGDIEQSGQAVWYEFWGLSGPNHQAEEGHDPYTWLICGTAETGKVEQDCDGGSGPMKDSPVINSSDPTKHYIWAIVKPPNSTGNKVDLGGLDVFRRYGFDLRPTTGDTCDAALPADRDPAICGADGVVVLCNGGATLIDDPATLIDEGGITTDACDSNAGPDGIYGTGDDGTIFYKEAEENKLRAFTRENVAYSFSFINGIGVNHPDLCGSLTATMIDADGSGGNGAETAGVTTECGDSPSTGTRQVMYQNIQDLGATLSCFNCSALGQHTVPSHGFDHYNFKWTPLPGVHIPEDHPETNGNIPEGGGQPSNGF